MKTTIILLLLLTTHAVAQSTMDKEEVKRRHKEYDKKGLVWKFDQFRNETVILTKPQIVYQPGVMRTVAAGMAKEDPGPTIVMSVGIQYRGVGTLDPMDEGILAIQMSAQQWQQLKSDHEVRLMFEGGEVVLLGTAEYNADIKARGGFLTSEMLLVSIKLKEIERMASAKQVMAQVGRFSFPIKEKQLKTFQPIIPEMKATKK